MRSKALTTDTREIPDIEKAEFRLDALAAEVADLQSERAALDEQAGALMAAQSLTGQGSKAEIGRINLQRDALDRQIQNARLEEAAVQSVIDRYRAEHAAAAGGHARARAHDIAEEARQIEARYAEAMTEAMALASRLDDLRQDFWSAAREAGRHGVGTRDLEMPRFPLRRDKYLLTDAKATMDHWLDKSKPLPRPRRSGDSLPIEKARLQIEVIGDQGPMLIPYDLTAISDSGPFNAGREGEPIPVTNLPRRGGGGPRFLDFRGRMPFPMSGRERG